MILEVATTPNATLVWAPTAQDADRLRLELTAAGHTILEADPVELDVLLRAAGEAAPPSLERAFNVKMSAAARDALTSLVDAGHDLTWHWLQRRPARKAWGVPVRVWHASRANPEPSSVAIPLPPASVRRTTTQPGRPMRARPEPVESAVHFGVKVRGSRALGLRLSRETYARINKRSSMTRTVREDDPVRWDAMDRFYEDAEHRIYTDDWCAMQRKSALENFDLNMAHFASLDPGEFESVLQKAVKSQRGLVEVSDLTRWDGVPGLYVMVFDAYCQVYVGATDQLGGVMARIKQHWAGAKPFDRLVWGDPRSSILSVNSFRALDTTRIFAAKTSTSFDRENKLIESFPAKFVLNRLIGGRETASLAGIVGVQALMKTRDFTEPIPPATEPRGKGY